MSATPSADQGAQKLALVLKPLLDEMAKGIKEHVTGVTQELIVQMGRMESRIELLEKLVGEKKKSATRGEKKTTDVATPAATGETAEAVPAPATGAKFALNKLVYFRDQFKASAEFRKKYVSDELDKLMEEDPTIKGKTKDDQKLIAKATYAWNYFKQHDTKTATDIENEYLAAKALHEAANKPPQQTVEPKTPQ